jgi:hypothetical protein
MALHCPARCALSDDEWSCDGVMVRGCGALRCQWHDCNEMTLAQEFQVPPQLHWTCGAYSWGLALRHFILLPSMHNSISNGMQKYPWTMAISGS